MSHDVPTCLHVPALAVITPAALHDALIACGLLQKV